MQSSSEFFVLSTTQERVPSFPGSLCENITQREQRIPAAWPWGLRGCFVPIPLFRGHIGSCSLQLPWLVPQPQPAQTPTGVTRQHHTPAGVTCHHHISTKVTHQHGTVRVRTEELRSAVTEWPKTRDVQPSSTCLTPKTTQTTPRLCPEKF